jgi:ABC-2 type transport system permease protein
MYKTYIIALREFRAVVRSKGFIVSLVAMPILMGGGIVVQRLLKDRVDTEDKHFAVVDYSGQFERPFAAAAEAYNQVAVFDSQGDERKKVKPAFVLEFVKPEGVPLEMTLKLSERVRNKELAGFLLINQDVVVGGDNAKISYHSQNSVDRTFRQWATGVLNQEIQRLRGEREGLDSQVLLRIIRPTAVQDLGLVVRDETTGEISEPKGANVLAQIFMPMGLMMLIFMSVMVGATPLMQAVMEEKQAKISEVLLGSVQPFQLMLGKLGGVVAVTLTTVLVYIAGAFFAMKYLEYDEYFPSADVIAWLVVFQTLAVLMYGALFIAIGAAVSDMREAQSALMPVMLLAMAPMFVWLNIVREPDSAMSLGMSLFPPATPMLMLLRAATPSGVPWWQPALGCVLVLLTTLFCVFAAGRIFRIGILMQGESVNLKRMAGWVLRG